MRKTPGIVAFSCLLSGVVAGCLSAPEPAPKTVAAPPPVESVAPVESSPAKPASAPAEAEADPRADVQKKEERARPEPAPVAERKSLGVGSAAAGLAGISAVGRGGGGGGPAGGMGFLGGKAAYAPAKRLQADFDATGSEGYRNYGVNPFTATADDRLSTFSIDVDTASYTIARRKILEGQLPPKDAVRVEEFVNYFRYDLAGPKDGAPFAVTLDAAPSPFTAGRHLLRVGLQARRLSLSERKPAHLTFLVDVSGSMHSPDKLPLAKKALRILVDNLRDGDTVGLVTYAGSVREVLPATGLEKKAEIHAAIEALTAGGSTAMASGLELAYRNAARTLSSDSTSRVLILSDGDANVGPTSHTEILRTIAGHVKEGVTLSVVGFGMGNYKDDLMEQFADKGNGNYSYVDTLLEAKRVFQEQLGGTLEVVAQDTKIQVDFDPARVRSYRLVGYENRDIADRDFRNDKVDAGEVGSGHGVTALYELELADAAPGALATVRVRAKKPRGAVAEEWAFAFDPARHARSFEAASADFRFAVAVMGAAEIFRQSAFARDWSLAQVEAIAKAAASPGNAERQEFISLLGRASHVVGAVAKAE